MKIGIDLIGGRISTSINSHKAAWAYLIANQLQNKYPDKEVKVLHKDESWDEYDYMCIYHGMEFSGGLNLFGGAKVDTANRFARILDFEGKMVSLDIDMPDYGALGKTRLKNCDDGWRETNWAGITEVCKKIPTMRHPNRSTSLIMGDSHAFSMYKPPMMVVRIDKKTLHGALKYGLKNLITDNKIDYRKLTYISLYFGNIDIRHHLGRKMNYEKVIERMFLEYEKQIRDLNISGVELIEALPIENESRKLPKTGYFEGTPFYGAWSIRCDIREFFNYNLNKIANRNGWRTHKHPSSMLNENFELSFDCMEKPRSVHLNMNYYRWNLKENKENKY